MNLVHLQGIGEVEGCEAGKLEKGMVCLWNYGERSEVFGIKPVGSKMVEVLMLSKNGDSHTRRFKKTRLVGISHRPLKAAA